MCVRVFRSSGPRLALWLLLRDGIVVMSKSSMMQRPRSRSAKPAVKCTLHLTRAFAHKRAAPSTHCLEKGVKVWQSIVYLWTH